MYTGICTIGAQCRENSIQLIGELSDHEGSVAICLGGSWGKICGKSLLFGQSINDGLNAAVVICRQLGLSTDGKFKTTTSYYRLLARPLALAFHYSDKN